MAPDTVEGRRLVIRLACLPLGAVLALGLVSAGGVSSATWQTADSRTGAATSSFTEPVDCVAGARNSTATVGHVALDAVTMTGTVVDDDGFTAR